MHAAGGVNWWAPEPTQGVCVETGAYFQNACADILGDCQHDVNQ
jgi:hypothetical protein